MDKRLLFDILLRIFLRKSSLAHAQKNDKLTFWQALSDLIESEKSLTNWTFQAKKASLKHEKTIDLPSLTIYYTYLY